ncbi:MAG TPA: hypothetical protein DCQ92_17105 [Verrucomicrobia subdivision 3 bacterium]|nr:hypothetical protein [Limisphaerales bacterium]
MSLLISLSLLFLSWHKAGAQLAPADDFFHRGAQFYISNNIPEAKKAVGDGLTFYPDDDKLKKLDELLKQQSQSQSQNSKDQQKQQSQAKPDQQKQDQKDQAEKSSGQKKEDEQKQPEQQKSASEKKDGEKPEDKNTDAQPVAPGQMTPAEAKRLLDSQKSDEQFLQLKPPEKPKDNQRKFKDW